MSLTFYILNVGHGSSVVVEFRSNGRVAFGLIDSNRSLGHPVRALEKLRELGANKLSFVCLTHPHADHYRGLKEILQGYEGKLDHFFSFPMGGILLSRDRLKKWAHALVELRKRTDDPDIMSAAQEFIWIIKWADEHRGLFTECDGDQNRIAPAGFQGVQIHTISPPRRSKGTYLNVIDTQNPMAFGTLRENEVSLAFNFEYAGKSVVIGGDANRSNWDWRRMHFERNSGIGIGAAAVNLPHHGSKADCSLEVLRQLFTVDSGQRKIAITSADGQSHPDLEVIETLERLGILPYCTNLIPACGAAISRLQLFSDIDAELARWLREVSTTTTYVQPCQGDVTVHIDHYGQLSVATEFERPCGYRGDYDTLLGAL